MAANEFLGKEKHTKKQSSFHAECDDITDEKKWTAEDDKKGWTKRLCVRESLNEKVWCTLQRKKECKRMKE